MPNTLTPPASQYSSLPIEYRVALDQVFLGTGGTSGYINADVMGVEMLRRELSYYAAIRSNDTTLIALGASTKDVTQAINQKPYQRVVTLTSGVLAEILRPIRMTPLVIPRGLQLTDWRSAGFVRSRFLGVQGIGAITWSVAERLAHQIHRPDLADRFRIAMLRSLVASFPVSTLTTLSVSSYRRFD